MEKAIQGYIFGLITRLLPWLFMEFPNPQTSWKTLCFLLNAAMFLKTHWCRRFWRCSSKRKTSGKRCNYVNRPPPWVSDNVTYRAVRLSSGQLKRIIKCGDDNYYINYNYNYDNTIINYYLNDALQHRKAHQYWLQSKQWPGVGLVLGWLWLIGEEKNRGYLQCFSVITLKAKHTSRHAHYWWSG